MKYAASLLFTLLLCSPAGALGGWIETDQDGGRTLYAAGKVKAISPEDPVWSVIDLRTGALLLVDSERRLFAETTVADYCLTVAEAMRASLAEMTPEEQEMMEELVATSPAGGSGKVSVVAAGPGGAIAGLETETYRVLVDGNLYQELWLAPQAPIMQEIRPGELRRLTGQFEQCTENPAGTAIGNLPEQDPAYRQLEASGWRMRTVTYSEGEAIEESEVVHQEQRELPAAEFQPPANCRPVPIRLFLEE